MLISLAPGQIFELPDGTTISFDGVKRYAAFDVAHDPFERWVLVSALTAVGGLILSLFVPRRRLWVRVGDRSGPDGTVVLEVAGLSRSDDPALPDDVRALATKLSEAQDGTGGPAGPSPADPVQIDDTTDDHHEGSAQ